MLLPQDFLKLKCQKEINSTEGQNKLKNIPIGRFGRIEEIASALFLSSNGASYITGEL